jgi:papain like protease
MSVIISPGGRRYDRVKDRRVPGEHMLAMPREFVAAPVVDLRQWVGKIKNQGQEGSCTGNAGAKANEWYRNHRFGDTTELAAQDVYANELIMNGDFPQDNGSDGETCCRVLVIKGVCPEAEYPYVAGQILAPTGAQVQAALANKMEGYHRLANSQAAIYCLAIPKPVPVLMGFDVYSSFESDEVASTGIYNPDTSAEQILGGHEVAACAAYDIGTLPTLRPSGCPPAVLIVNSWGTGWGWQGSGMFWAVLAVLDEADTDLMVVHGSETPPLAA